MSQEVERVYEEPPTHGRQFIYAFAHLLVVLSIAVAFMFTSGIDDTMATWSEELLRLTLFDGEAELTPESRPAWQQNMELRTRFAEGIPGKVFFSIVSTCRYVTVAERTEHLELRGLTGQRLVVTSGVVREAFGIPRDTARDEEQGATWPNQIINDYLLCKAGSGPNPSRRYNLPAVSAYLRLTYYRLVNWVHMLAGGLASAVKEYVRKFSGGTSEAVVMLPGAAAKEGAPVEEPPQQAEGRQEDIAIPGFEPSDDELPIGTLRMDISRLRQEVQRTEPLVIRDVGGEGPAGRQEPSHTGGQIVSAPEPPRRLQTGAGRQAFNSYRQKAIEQIPLLPSGHKKKGKKIPVVQSGPGENPSAQPPAGEQSAAPATVEEERPDIGPRYIDEEVRRFHLELFVQLGATPPTAGVPQTIPMEKTLLDRLAEISRPEAMSGTAEEDQAVRDVVRDPDLPCIVLGETSEASMARYSEQLVAMVKHWTMEKMDGRSDAVTSAQDDLRQTTEELAKARIDWEKQTQGLQEELHKVQNDVVQREEETGRWIRNEEKMAEFVWEIARLREELLAKDARLRDLQKTLREQPGEVQSEQLESARKEFHDVEQRFALVESPDLSDTSLPSFSPVLVETLRKTLDAEFDLMRQLQSVLLATPGATTSAAREQTPEATTPASPERPLAEFQTPEGQTTAMETDTSTTTLEKERLEDRVRELSAQLDQVQPQLEQSRQEKEATDRRVQELATQLERAQFQLEKVRTKADLKAAFADLDTVQSQLDEEHERNSKLQDKVNSVECQSAEQVVGVQSGAHVIEIPRGSPAQKCIGVFGVTGVESEIESQSPEYFLAWRVLR
ncbi:hypothetical protein R1flu_022252 [Riccia fluitans]|uniref:Uncharacterized protein n=1 Tax=Riccia fluitans TaxID=41844 RepID=A0ABD1ZUQ5_9MARC